MKWGVCWRGASKTDWAGGHTLAMVRRFGLLDAGEYPLFRLVQELVANPMDVEARFRALMQAGGQFHKHRAMIFGGKGSKIRLLK